MSNNAEAGRMKDAEGNKLSWVEVMRLIFSDCIDHPHEQVGRCVYCQQCGRRLYQGEVMPLEERIELKTAMRGEDA